MKCVKEGVKEKLNMEIAYFHSFQNITFSWLPNTKITI
jgi:hypothetical protein